MQGRQPGARTASVVAATCSESWQALVYPNPLPFSCFQKFHCLKVLFGVSFLVNEPRHQHEESDNYPDAYQRGDYARSNADQCEDDRPVWQALCLHGV